MFELKSLGPDSIGKALQKVERYRLLNEPAEPTIAPVRGMGLGRDDGENAPQAPSVFARLMYAAMALIVAAMMIVVSIANFRFFTNDFPAVMGVTVFAALFIVTMNLLVDVAYAALDPRVRYS